MEQERSRKVRCDKKRTVAPIVDMETHDLISRIAYVCEKPLKDIGELLCIEGLNSKKVIASMAGYFRRDLQIENVLHLGQRDRRPYRNKLSGEKTRLYMRFPEVTHTNLDSLSFALDCSISAAATLLLQSTLANKEILYRILTKFVHRDINETRRKQLRRIVRELDLNSDEYRVTWTMLLSHIINESIESGRKVSSSISNWIERSR